ncbi:uncharacterized protein LOC111463513 isoform X1 [Cucurbita moschata]|uniref:Uncharacterized protein LOC111463513 isoform X1 n=1 Tax=Cucurbita moschata TaxID=3662 RepID=A0A6J1HER5_CUCMO|nr:uncharacterized protein LOC111463513 isoform X1 [Cucurbita moschata]XP_022963242.1 uncharacterized protein LOC111463513 isoform X1 [Cucurbita moschata]
MSTRYHIGVCSLHLLLFSALINVLLQAVEMNAIAVPSSSCYVFDNSSHIIDFSSWIGHPFEYEEKGSDLVVQFCKDVESRSQVGYVDFGRFDKFNYFVSGSGHADFVQDYYNGDLTSCEHSYDKLGRTAQVNVMCRGCLNGQCKGGLGCICNITHESSCRSCTVIVDLAIPCEIQGPRVFKGFTVGFHPRSWEIVYNGLTQLGYEKPHRAFSFSTEQTSLVLYMTAIASLSSFVQKPIIQVFPENGLEVKVSGSGATGSYPTTLSPSMLMIDWRCDIARDVPYAVNVTIPVADYEPINFFLAKMCEKRQDVQGDYMQGWATFGILSCLFIVGSSLFCCGGFVYKTQVQGQRGIDALPGMTLLSACLETVSGAGHSYPRAEGFNDAIVSEASWDRPSSSSSSRPTRIPSEKNYGSI